MQITIWSVNYIKLKYLIWTLFACGWIYFVLGSFAINHFDLFGLRQVLLYWKGALVVLYEKKLSRSWREVFSEPEMSKGNGAQRIGRGSRKKVILTTKQPGSFSQLFPPTLFPIPFRN